MVYSDRCNPNRDDLIQSVLVNFSSYQEPQLGKDIPSHSRDFQGFNHSCCIQKCYPLQVCLTRLVYTKILHSASLFWNHIFQIQHNSTSINCYQFPITFFRSNTIQLPSTATNPYPYKVQHRCFSTQFILCTCTTSSNFKSQLLHTKLLSSASLLSNHIFQIQHKSTLINYYRSPVPLHTPLNNASRLNNVPYKIWCIQREAIPITMIYPNMSW